MTNGRIQQRINPALRREAEQILRIQGIKPSQAIILFYTEVKRTGGLPFSPSPVTPAEIPNARLRKNLKEAAKGRGVKTYNSEKDFFDALHAL
jgi:addiction module RelB/DinJ family antitoxin